MRKVGMIAAFSLLAACKRDIQNPEAVRSSVVDYLRERQSKTGLNVDLMTIDVANLSFSSSGNEAHAVVTVAPKAGGAGMQLPYDLDRKGDKWVVRGHSEGQNPHAGAGLPSLPPSHPPVPPGDKQP